jgi:hypothetical protein
MLGLHAKKICLVTQEKEILEQEKTINQLDSEFYRPVWTNEEKEAFKPIDRVQENKDVVLFQKTGDVEVFEKLYANRIPTLKVWANKYYYLLGSADDMFGELSFYFSKAVKKYDKKRGSFNTCLYTFLLHRIKNIRNGKKAKKRKPVGADPHSISNCTLSLDYDYNTKDGNESTLKDLLANESDIGEKDIIEKINLEETINVLSKINPNIQGFLKRLGDGNTISSLIKELRLKKGRIKLNKAQANKLKIKNKCNRVVSDIIKDKTDIVKFQLVEYKVTSTDSLHYTVELPKTKEADLVMKTIRHLRTNKEYLLNTING